MGNCRKIFNFSSSLQLSKTVLFVSVVNTALTKKSIQPGPCIQLSYPPFVLLRVSSFHPHLTYIFGSTLQHELVHSPVMIFSSMQIFELQKVPPSFRYLNYQSLCFMFGLKLSVFCLPCISIDFHDDLVALHPALVKNHLICKVSHPSIH